MDKSEKSSDEVEKIYALAKNVSLKDLSGMAVEKHILKAMVNFVFFPKKLRKGRPY